jgi:hypothetical protein
LVVRGPIGISGLYVRGILAARTWAALEREPPPIRSAESQLGAAPFSYVACLPDTTAASMGDVV